MAMRLVDGALLPIALDACDRHQASDTARVSLGDNTVAFDPLDSEVVRPAVAWMVAIGTDWHVGHRDLVDGSIMMTPTCYEHALKRPAR
jgi:hypothetical protein